MKRAMRLLTLLVGLWCFAAFAQQQDEALQDAPTAETAAKALADTRDDPAARQKVQPYNNAPIWRQVNSAQAFSTQLPKFEGGVLIEPRGEDWRQLRNGPMTVWGGWFLVAVLILIALFYLYRGQIRLQEPPTGQLIERFTFVERATHWLNAACFIVLGLTGILMLFGKHLILPITGYTIFSILGILSKTTHNFVGPLFAVTTIAIFLIFVRDNWIRGYDIRWLVRFGGLLSKSSPHVPSGRFNGGEKAFFWLGVVVLGIIVSVAGFVLDFPNFEQTRFTQQTFWWIHVGAALLFLALVFGHIYIGTIGMEGALEAMESGYVDETWAKEHHRYWYDDIRSGKIPARRSDDATAAALPSQLRG
ncbi:MAG: formate dehydrogenase subunit gamma [Burkholderiaceae bacterium]|nr:formate dehydrogenase subunit gamma [Burkholderiaceae bacterium]